MKNKIKTNKAVAKRFKVTATGKLMRRPTRQDHFNAKATGSARRFKRKLVPVAKADIRGLKKLIPYA